MIDLLQSIAIVFLGLASIFTTLTIRNMRRDR